MQTKRQALVIYVVMLFLFITTPAYGTCASSKTPENPSMILFLAGSAVLGFKYLRAKLS